jgi:DNA-directed RNA polymerase subunit RPC12/RpoP
MGNISVCPNCKNEFDYTSIPESGMGYVKCPKCDKPVTQKDIK